MHIFKTLTLFFVTTGTLLILYLLYFLAPTSLSSEKIRFVIPLETSQEEIVSQLKSQGFIRWPKLFIFIASLLRYPGTIEPGAYLLSHRQTAFGIVNTLLYHPSQKWIILVPGLRREQVAERLAKKFEWTAEKETEFLEFAQEGYLFPDTYLLNVDYTPKEFAQKLINNFNEKFDAVMQKDLLAQNVRIDTAVKIASLIERESGFDEDKPLIAGIIWNRLNIDMKLQIDATSQYLKGKTGDWWPIVTPQDHKIDSPYNTYLYKGLPPTPIANPGLASLKAVIYSQETDCLFYLHDRSKQIHCAKTYQEHLDNIDTYLR